MINEHLYVDERGIVRKAKVLQSHPYRIVVSDEPYKPNGRNVFVNPDTNFLEEGEMPHSRLERQINLMTQGTPWRKTFDFESNGNKVLFHPELREFAEVHPGYGWGNWDKVMDLEVRY